MYLSHIFTRYFEGNKNDSPSSKQICAPLRLLKYSLITVFYPKVIVECVPKWITFPLSLPRSHSLSCRSFPPLLLSFSFLLQVSFSLSNGLHMSAKWPWHCCDKVKCPGAPSHAVPSRVRSQCSAYSTQPQPSANPPVQTKLQDPHSSVTLPVLCNRCLLSVRKKLTLWVF